MSGITNQIGSRSGIVNGNIGIGLSDPTQLLHLKSTTDAKPNLLIETENAGANGGRLDFLHKSSSPADGDLLGDISFGGYSDDGTPPSDFARYVMIKAYAEDVSNNAEKGKLVFSLHDGASNENHVDVMTISGGDVGIGTTSPAATLDVQMSAASGYSAHFANKGDIAGSNGIQVEAGNTSASGTTYYFNALDGNGVQQGVLKTVTGGFSLANISDRRIKRDIVNTAIEGIKVVKAMQIRDFKYKNTPVDDPYPAHVGFIAQELQSVFPNAVDGKDGDINEDGSVKSMTVSRELLVPVLVKAIQEQQTLIESLTAKVTALENA